MKTARELGEASRQANQANEAYDRGEISDDQRRERLRDLREPKGFLAKLSWKFLGI